MRFRRRWTTLIAAGAVVAAGAASYLVGAGGGSRPGGVAGPPAGLRVPAATDAPPYAAPLPGLPAVRCPAPTVTVSDAAQLQAALDAATPGSVIRLRAGVYPGRFVAAHPGTQRRPIWLCGTRTSIIDGSASGPTNTRGVAPEPYGLHLVGASWWNVVGLSVRNGQKGVVLDSSSNDLLYRLTVYDTGDEGIHLRTFSSDDTVEGCVVRYTGRSDTKFGEGIYVGSAVKNWGRYTGGMPDRSDADRLLYNDIAYTTAENIDIKEGTASGYIAFNSFDGRGMVASAAHSWVNVKGNGYRVYSNTGRYSLGDGFTTYQIVPGDGRGNVFSSNRIGPGVDKYGFSLIRGNVLACNNVGAGLEGQANVRCTA